MTDGITSTHAINLFTQPKGKKIHKYMYIDYENNVIL